MEATSQSDNKSLRLYRLLGSDRLPYESPEPGQLGGNFPLRIYGRLDCWSARKALANGGYIKNRVFFANEKSAVAAGFRPCGHCLRKQYRVWKRGGALGSSAYPWLVAPGIAVTSAGA